MIQSYNCVALKRWQLGTPYFRIADDLAIAVENVGEPLIVMDLTGVGGPVGEIIKNRLKAAFKGKSRRIAFVGVTITAGRAVTHPGDGLWHVAKRELASIVSALVGSKRLKMAESDPLVPILKKELASFRVKVTEAGNETFESWRERDHDDLVLSLALACWAAESIDWHPPPLVGATSITRRIIGLDIGKLQDFSALTVIEHTVPLLLDGAGVTHTIPIAPRPY